MFTSLWRQLQRKQKTAGRKARPVRRFRPFAEELEKRLAPATITVTTTADDTTVDGSVSLREAILSLNQGSSFNADVNAQLNPYGTSDTILFNIPGGGLQTISLSSALPALAVPMTIDGSSQPGGSHLIVLDGTSAGSGVDGLDIGTGADGSKIEGLTITKFSGDGIGILGTNNNTVGGTTAALRNIISGNTGEGVDITLGGTGNLIEGNFIGVGANGTAASPNADGVVINASASNIVGPGNVISGNTAEGVLITNGSASNSVVGNFIGTNSTGTVKVANGGDGVQINGTGSDGNTVGGTTTAARNIIAGNTSDGVFITGGPSGNLVDGNLIGTNAVGSALLGNGLFGVHINGSSNNTVGVVPAGGGGSANVIAKSTNDGVEISDGTGAASGNVVAGNFIGTNAANLKLGNAVGVVITGASSTDNTVGGTTTADRNIISANTGNGVDINTSAATNVVEGNFIGTNGAGTAKLSNGGDGVRIETAATGNTVGGTASGTGNVISGNTGDGIEILTAATGNLVTNNNIGTNALGTAKLPNAVGIIINGTGTNGNTVGDLPFANLISGNTGDGVDITGGAAQNTVAGNFIGTNGTNSTVIGNGGNGVAIVGSPNNFVGATAVPNLISGNVGAGVDISGAAATGNTVANNAIGVTNNGTAALPNAVGVKIESAATGNSVGVGGVAANLISGNTTAGIQILTGANSNLIVNNAIGTNNAVTAKLANGVGVIINGTGTTGNMIGSSAAGSSNVIAGNTNDGVDITGGASGNTVAANFIGTNSILATGLGNGGDGVSVGGSTTTGNLIGGATSADGNFIGANAKNGVHITAATNNEVTDNLIGANAAGTTKLPNKTGVMLDGAASGNTVGVGGPSGGGGNVISGNTTAGVQILAASTGNLVAGNEIGTDSTATVKVANGTGVIISGPGTSGNTVGGAGAGNVISGNTNDGVDILAGASANTVSANFIGTNAAEATGLGNGGDGVSIGGTTTSSNLVGGPLAADGNRIDSNVKSGVHITGATVTEVAGNLIGSNAAGTTKLPNLTGVTLDGAANNNTVGVGGPSGGLENIIAGNTADGVDITGAAFLNVLADNDIGTNDASSAAIGNGGDGVFIAGGSHNNTVGSTSSFNLISHNGAAGVDISGATTNSNTVEGNQIGTTFDGTAALGNTTFGVIIQAGSHGNTVGGSAGASTRNQISGNGSDGVRLASGATGNFVEGNFIGTDTTGILPVGNTGSGVAAVGGSNGNVIGGPSVAFGNTIAFNGAGVNAPGGHDGVLVSASIRDQISHNSIFQNAHLGIELVAGGNNLQPPPVLTLAGPGNTGSFILGTLTGPPNSVYTLEFFATPPSPKEPSGAVEGATFIGSVTVNVGPTGKVNFAVAFASKLPVGQLITATATDALGNTSQFSNAVLSKFLRFI